MGILLSCFDIQPISYHNDSCCQSDSCCQTNQYQAPPPSYHQVVQRPPPFNPAWYNEKNNTNIVIPSMYY